VLVYWKNWANEVYLLPKDLSDGDNIFDYYFHVGSITLLYYKHSGASVSEPQSTNKFRYVLIPQGTTSRPANNYNTLRQILSEKGVDINDYHQVCEYFNIKP